MKILNLYCGQKVWLDKKGYATVWVNGKNKKVHVLVWEKRYGKKPKGYQLHHIDEDKANWHIDNLELVTQSDHFRIHAGWIKKNGKWILKPCKICKKLLPLDSFYKRKTLKHKTPSHICMECAKQEWNINARKNGIKPRRCILPNDRGEYFCIKCKKWNIKEKHTFSNKKAQSYCKNCFNKIQKICRKKRNYLF